MEDKAGLECSPPPFLAAVGLAGLSTVLRVFGLDDREGESANQAPCSKLHPARVLQMLKLPVSPSTQALSVL